MLKRFLAMLAVTAVLAFSVFSYYRTNGTRTDGIYYDAVGIRPDAAVMHVNGEAVCAEEYLYWLDSVCEYLVSYLGGTPDFTSAVTEEMTLGEYAKADAANTSILYALVRQLAREHGIALTQADLDELALQRAQYVTYYGSEEAYALQLQVLGLTEAQLMDIEAVPYLYNHLYRQFSEPDGKLYPGEDALRKFGDENGYVTAQLLYLTTAGLDEATAADMALRAADFASQLQAAADKQAAYRTLAESLGMTVSDSGFTFCAADSDAAVHAAVAALQPGQVSEAVLGESGYYVALRMETNYAALGEHLFNIYLQEWQESAKVEYSEKVYDRIDAGVFYTALSQARAALLQSHGIG